MVVIMPIPAGEPACRPSDRRGGVPNYTSAFQEIVTTVRAANSLSLGYTNVNFIHPTMQSSVWAFQMPLKQALLGRRGDWEEFAVRLREHSHEIAPHSMSQHDPTYSSSSFRSPSLSSSVQDNSSSSQSNPMAHQTESGTSSDQESTVTVIPGGEVSGVIQPPGSKSLTNRALICAAVARGTTKLTGALVSEDTEVMLDSLSKLGIQATVSDAGTTVELSGRPQNSSHEATQDDGVRNTNGDPIELYIANSGTSVRFLTAALSAMGGNYRLSGLPRMHERPIGDLTQAIHDVIDGSITTESENRCPPVLIRSNGWKNHHLQVAGNVSSQYLSGLMMAAPLVTTKKDNAAGDSASETVRIQVTGELVSRPYVEMTASVMRSFGAEVEISGGDRNEDLTVEVSMSGYSSIPYAIEPDASAASYFWAAAAITGGSVEVVGLTPSAMQGDVGFCNVLEKMGCTLAVGPNSMTISGRAQNGIDVDMNHISDTVQTLAVVALFADGPTRIRGVAHNRFKETDRIGDLACELRKLGACVTEHEDGLTIEANTSTLHGNTLDTYQDHRMAMSLSLAGLRIRDVQIRNPSCTAKTYPGFFADLEQLIGRSHHWRSNV